MHGGIGGDHPVKAVGDFEVTVFSQYEIGKNIRADPYDAKQKKQGLLIRCGTLKSHNHTGAIESKDEVVVLPGAQNVGGLGGRTGRETL